MATMTRKQRVGAALQGREVDRPPISLWRHFFSQETSPRGLATAMLRFERRYGWDFMKVNPRASYHGEDWGLRTQYSGDSAPKVVDWPIKGPRDWEKIKPLDPRHGVLGEQLEALRLIGEGLRGQVPYLMTVFTPLSVAGRICGSPEAMLPYLRDEPPALRPAIEAITVTFIAFVKECLSLGASGLFFATTDWGTYDKLTDAEYAKFGRPYDLRVLQAASAAEFNMLHVCKSRNMLRTLADYPVHAFNWDASDPSNPTLAQGKAITKKVVIGGLDQKTTLPKRRPEDVAAQVRQARQQTGGVGWMAGPGCTYPPETPEANVAAAREAMRQG